MVRKVLGAIVGVAVAILTVMIVQWISHSAFPPPAGMEFADSETISTYLATAPVSALAIVAAGYFIATFDGVLAAALIGRGKPAAYGALVGLLMLVATVSNLILIPHPAWFAAVSLAGITLAALLGVALSRRLLASRAGVQ